MNSDQLEDWIATILHPFTVAVMAAKEETVQTHGTASNLPPTFVAFRTDERLSILGSCAVQEHRMISHLRHGTTRWMNLCRQVVRLTGSDMALVAIEVTMNDPPINTLEISMVTPESVTTTLRPYRCLAGRTVEWLGQAVPDNDNVCLGGLLEVEAAQLAWTSNEVAYPTSVRYLSELCGCIWNGDQAMIDALSAHPSPN